MGHPRVASMRGKLVRAGAACVLACVAGASMGQTYTLLGTLPGGTTSEARAVSADGTTVVGVGYPSETAFRWTQATGMQALPFLVANGVNADGTVVVGGILRAGRGHACRWIAPGGLVVLGELPGWLESSATAVSADGTVVVGTCARDVQPDFIAVRWDLNAGTVEALGPSDFNSEAQGISADGSVTVGRGPLYHAGTTLRAPARWDGAAMTAFPIAEEGFAFAVTPDGSKVVGRSFGSVGPFLWTSSGVVSLAGAGANGYAAGISDDGSLIVGTVFTNQPAFVWTPRRGRVPLQSFLSSRGVDLTNRWPLEARGVSADGMVIVGNAGPDSTHGQAFILNIGRGTGLLCGPADFDGDGSPGTDQDIEAFFACLGGNCRASCGADFDGDGDVATDADIEAFFRVLGGGHC